MKYLFAVFFLFAVISLNAQRTITGTITNKQNQPLCNVNISVKNTNIKTVSDSSGRFNVFIPTQIQTIDFSKTDYREQEIYIESDTMNVVLIPHSDQPSLIDLSLDEMLKIKVFTAGKKTQEVADIPASVVVITQKEIELFGYRTLSEILENISGMFLVNDYSFDGLKFGVRGFWNTIANDDIMILIDNVDQVNLTYSSYGLSKMAIPVETIERIEIIRGPMSVIYGSGAFFGVINIITKKETEFSETKNKTTFSAGTGNTGSVAVHLTGKSDDFEYSLNCGYFSTNGIDQDYKKMNDNSGIFKTSSTKNFLFEKYTYFNFSGKFKKFYTDFLFNESKNGLYFLSAPLAGGSWSNGKSTIVTLGYNNKFLNKLTLDSKITIYENFVKMYYDQAYTPTYDYQDVPYSAWDYDLTLNFKLNNKYYFTLGGKYRSILNVENNLHLPTLGLPANYYSNTTQTIGENSDINSAAAFLQADFSPFKKIKFVIGGRVEKQFKYTLKTIVADTLFGQPAIVNSSEYCQDKPVFIPRIAAIYNLNKKNIIKLMYGQAVNHPSFFQIQNSGIYGLDLKPEKIESYEINYLATPFTYLAINTSVFYNKLKGLILRTTGFDENGEYYSFNSNTGFVDTKGFEITLKFNLKNKLSIETSASYQKTTHNDKKQTVFNYSPALLGNVKVFYPVSKYITTSVMMYYVDAMETYMDFDRTAREYFRIGKKVPAYYSVTAGFRIVDLPVRNLYFDVHCTNLLNSNIYYPSTTNNNTIFPKGTLAAKRQISLSIGYKF